MATGFAVLRLAMLFPVFLVPCRERGEFVGGGTCRDGAHLIFDHLHGGADVLLISSEEQNIFHHL